MLKEREWRIGNEGLISNRREELAMPARRWPVKPRCYCDRAAF
jgi:hypothetical protein